MVGTGCSLILLVGMVNSRFFFLGSFTALAPFQQFSVLCILPHVSHLGLGTSFWAGSFVFVLAVL